MALEAYKARLEEYREKMLLCPNAKENISIRASKGDFDYNVIKDYCKRYHVTD